MGMTHIDVAVAHPAKPGVRVKVRMLVDSGGVYSVLPETICRQLGIKSYEEESFILANGEDITRKIGDALFFYKNKRGPSKVIFGQPGDSSLIGVVTLESLGFTLDPIRRELRPMKMVLM
jgi:predicted aspartyl protease